MSARPLRLTWLLLAVTSSAFAVEQALPLVRVGSEPVSADVVARVMARIPPFQWTALGPDDKARRLAVLERFLIPELQKAAEARARGIDERPRTRERLRDLYARAMDAELRRSLAEQQPVSDADVQKYFDEHKARFETPRRVRIWRILVNDEQLAKTIIAESRGAPGPAKWRNFAREHSLDPATKFRDGDLGFVRPDGSTETPQLRVDPALFAAVEALEDGQIAPEPLKLASGIAVVWRRGSLPAIKRTVEQEAPAIRTVLSRQRLEAAHRELVAELRKKSLTAFDPQLLLDLPDATFASPEASARSLPPLPSASVAPAFAQKPEPGERGTR
jgi:peptidyl-prolyl cis-trans isomerase C